MNKVKFHQSVDLRDFELEHVGNVRSESTDAYEMLIPLGKDYTAILRVDAEAIQNSGYFDQDKEVSPNSIGEES